MMNGNSITAEVKTHHLFFKDDKARKPLRVTTKQVATWNYAKDHGQSLILLESDGSVMFNGSPWAFDEAVQFPQKVTRVWICQYAERHDMREECDCYDRYGMPPWEYADQKKLDNERKSL